MKANISPLPWRCDGTKIIAKSQMPGEDREELVVDLAPGTGLSVNGTKAVASYIVQACNAYPKLVEALRLCNRVLLQTQQDDYVADAVTAATNALWASGEEL